MHVFAAPREVCVPAISTLLLSDVQQSYICACVN